MKMSKRNNGREDPITRLVESLKKLPGIGAHSATRMAFYILRSPQGYAKELAQRILDVTEQMVFCSRCQDVSITDPCARCTDESRDATLICVVEDPQDVRAIEKTGVYNGLYHVLHGALSPLEGIGPEDIRLKQLFDRLLKENIKEVIIATNFNAEGEATANFIGSQMIGMNIKVTRIARGVPIGGDLEYIDEVTLGEAISYRADFSEKEKRRNKKMVAKKIKSWYILNE